jgi:hypothetical protein
MTSGGYLDPLYAASLSEWGEPRALPRSGGSILVRAIAGSPDRDGMGPYPIFCCADWSKLREDVNELASDLVSLVLVADPFGAFDEDMLRRSFDVVSAFKEHRVADLREPREKLVSKHHAYYAKRALRTLHVAAEDEPVRALDEWASLYDSLKERHALRGIKAFSRAAFEKQLPVIKVKWPWGEEEIVKYDLPEALRGSPDAPK